MEEEGKVAVDVDVEEKVQEEALSLLLQGKFQDCYLICQRFFNARLTESRSTLLPTVDFDAPPKAVLTPAFSLCLTYLQCLFELHQAKEFEEEVEEKVRQGLARVEVFLVQRSPVPFVVAVTWIQLLIQLDDCQKAKQMLTACLNVLAKDAHARKSSSEDKRGKYALLANLYTVYTLPRLGQLVNAKRFLAMHKNGTLLTQSQILSMVQALDQFTSADESTVGRGAAIDPGNMPELERTGTGEGQGEEGDTTPAVSEDRTDTTRREEKKEQAQGGPHEIVVSVEQAVGIAVATILCGALIAKRQSLRKVFQTNISKALELKCLGQLLSQEAS